MTLPFDPQGFQTVNVLNLAGGTVSISNSFSAGLIIGGTLTGTWEKVVGFGDLLVEVNTDQVSAALGLQVQWSHDGVTETASLRDSFTINPSGYFRRVFAHKAAYFRVVYVNVGVAATLWIQATLFNVASLASPVGGNTFSNTFGTTAPRAPTSINDNLVHEVTNAAGGGMQLGRRYVVTQVGGEALQVMEALAAPSVAVCRTSPYFLTSYDSIILAPTVAGSRLWIVKAVDGTANASTYCDSPDGGTGA
jgi:hypothetical protein